MANFCRESCGEKLVPLECWHHIKRKENPADCASRGISPSKLSVHNLWWNGPSWFSDSSLTTQNLNRLV